jgi:hypothetical protein
MARQANDFYSTPVEAVKPLNRYIDFKHVYSFYEPCYGDGVIQKTLSLYPGTWVSHSEIFFGKDYLIGEKPIVDLIVTNPPFSQAQEFLEKSLEHGRCVIYLLRLGFLASQKRKDFWKANPPSHLFTLSKRPSFTGEGKTDNSDYGWVVWDKINVVKTKGPFTWI